MSSRHWIELTFRLAEIHQEPLLAQLSELGCTGFLQEDETLKAYIPGTTWSRRLAARIRNTHKVLLARLGLTGQANFRVRRIEEKLWNARWERSAGIVDVTATMIIKPSWRKLRARDRGKMVLHIDPKMSFGTGHHETTRLCLVLLEENVRDGMNVLDVGCGTGVLAIAAAKLGARSVEALDTDDWAFRSARENIRKNNVRNVRITRGDVSRVRRKSYDLIASNIDHPTNIRILPALTRRLAAGGCLILSGLLSSDLPALLDSLRGRELVPIQCLEENEWVALALLKTDANQLH